MNTFIKSIDVKKPTKGYIINYIIL